MINKIIKRVGFIKSEFPIYVDGKIVVEECMTTVLVTEEYGTILFDTGSPTESDVVVNSLSNDFGVTTDDVRFVFNTHILHADHTGSNHLFKKAKTILSRNEFELAKELVDFLNTNVSNSLLTDYLIKRFPGYSVNCGEAEAKGFRNYMDFFWDENKLGNSRAYLEDKPDIPPFISCLPTPGHTLNHYSFIIEDNEQTICVAGDAIAKKDILTKDVSRPEDFGVHMDFDSYFKSIEKLKRQEGLLVPGHDDAFQM